jgi:RNA polymerase sigma-70 factor (ECF subfamily)
VSRGAPDATLGRGPESVALADLFQAHGDFVQRALRRLGLSPADAEDGVQDVFLVVGRRLEGYEERGALRSWLFVICRQIARQHRRRRKDHARLEDEPEPPAIDDDPAAAAERREAVTLVQDFLDSLSESQSLVFYLSEVEGLSAPEVAAALDVSVNTVYGRLRLSRERFEALLSRRAARERRAWSR